MGKRIVLSGYFGFKNFGDEAILSLLVSKLQKDKHRLTVISSNPDFTKKQYKHIRSIYTFKIYDIIGAIAKSDILISGGGSLLQDVTSLKSLLYYLFIIFIALVLRKKVIIFAQGIGPINNEIGLFLTREILKHCSYVSVRDKKSFDFVKDLNTNAQLLCDPVFSIGIPEVQKEKVLAVQLRDFKTLTMDFLDRLAQSVVKNFSDYKIEIYSFQDSIDLSVCQNFKNRLEMLNSDLNIEVFYNMTNEEILTGLAKAQYVIAMRFHAIIAGLIAGAKILAINYDSKVEKISVEFGLPILDLKKDFTNQFEVLKNQNTDKTKSIVKTKEFNWGNFDKVVNGLI